MVELLLKQGFTRLQTHPEALTHTQEAQEQTRSRRTRERPQSFTLTFMSSTRMK